MMEIRPYKRFKAAFLQSAVILVLVQAACASSPSPLPSLSAVSPAPLLEMKGELSTTQVVDGSLVLLSVTLPAPESTDSKLSAEFEGTALPFFPTPSRGPLVFQTLFGIPHDHKPGLVSVTVRLGKGPDAKSLNLPLMVADGKYRSEELHVSARHVNPKKKDMVRIRKEQAEVGLIYSHLTEEKFWSGPFVLPVESSVTSPFGTKRVFNGKMQSFHGGLDLKAPTGTKIFSPAPGRVVLAKHLFFTGNTVMIDHGYGLITLYAHMSKLKVKKGQQLASHTLLGLSGMTGRANGPHLHWQAIVHKIKVNPMDLTKLP